MIQRTSTQCDHPIRLNHWENDSAEELAEVIAWLLLGRRAHVENILHGNLSSNPGVSDANIDEAISHLDCPVKTSPDKYGNALPHHSVVHRDGWLFQFISWIAAKEEFSGAVVKAPHHIKAHKGFDGMLIELSDSAITSVLLSEDKATDNPRGTVSGNIWPEFEIFEAGKRDNEIAAEASTLLERVPDIDVYELTRSATWFQNKRYRASVATSEDRLPPEVHTFAGFDEVVGGAEDRRLANLLVCDDMRPFFEDLAQQVIAHLNSLRPASNV